MRDRKCRTQKQSNAAYSSLEVPAVSDRLLLRLCSPRGAQVAIGDIDSDRLREAARNLSKGGDLLPLALDVTSPVSAKAAVGACQETFGGLDTLINSAGGHPLCAIGRNPRIGLGIA